MDKSVKKQGVLSGLVWKVMEHGGISLMTFVINIVLARLLDPEAFGIVGIITVFVAVSNVFVIGGFSNALVQKKDADKVDFSSVFYVSLLVSIICYAILFFASPFIASFYAEPILKNVLRVQALILILGVYNSVVTAKLQKELKFKAMFVRSFVSVILSSIIGIFMAYKGFGIWALVAYNVCHIFFNGFVLFITERWIPQLVFSLERVKGLFSFGSKMLLSNLIDTIYNNIYSLVIGKIYSKDTLGYYNKGKNFPNMIISNLNNAIQAVLFPVMAKSQDNKEQLKIMARRSITVSCFIIFPAMAGLAGVSTSLVKILLTDKWLPAVPFICFCCATYAFWPVHTANLQAITAMGRSDIYLKLEIMKKTVGILGLIISAPFGIYTMMWTRVLVTGSSVLINSSPNKKLLNYGFLEQMKDILPSLILSLVMCGVVLLINLLGLNPYITILIQLITGVLVYVLGAKILRIEALSYVMKIAKGFLNKNEKQTV